MSLLAELGYAPDQRVVVVHVDDLGMSHAANAGGLRAMQVTATCGSIMVPCPGFAEMAGIARERPELDLGVHLTLNCEYESHRWGPVRSDVPSLAAPDGGMWRTVAETVAHAIPEEVDRELRAQIYRALEAGVDVTHIDSHMGAVFDLRFVDIYFRLAHEFKLPAFIPRLRKREARVLGLGGKLAEYERRIDAAEAAGFPVFDQFEADSLSFTPGTGLAHNSARVDRLEPGLAYLITHCAEGGPELESITRDWRQRDEEHRIYSDGSMAKELERRGIRTSGMRPLRERLNAKLR
ncbi:MAG: polysaccharide deacetylase family protein [Myxococcota bacterium]